MSLLPIVLGVARGPSLDAAGRSRPAPVADHEAIMDKVLERDQQRCRFCGFESRKYQEVVALNGDDADLRAKNLATACIFCHQCFHLEQIGETRAGTLIWLPEIPQAALNQICRAIFIARITSGPMADAARKALDVLMERREAAAARLGSDDPVILAAVMQDFLEDRDYAKRAARLKGIRLLPLDRRIVREGDMEFNKFPQILAYWRSKDGPFGEAMPAGWFDLFDRMCLKAAA